MSLFRSKNMFILSYLIFTLMRKRKYFHFNVKTVFLIEIRFLNR
uniref:Ribosomal protein L32 n=1 Tax=Adenocalymma gracielzae TaxID=2099420 RepID=A0A2P1GFT8_9LAMI|nr:ribosomal protein L32 [Adenocalymma gracielzae]AVM83831.1 ribosomal protein L32 [Adenocalymma gracielzae]